MFLSEAVTTELNILFMYLKVYCVCYLCEAAALRSPNIDFIIDNWAILANKKSDVAQGDNSYFKFRFSKRRDSYFRF